MQSLKICFITAIYGNYETTCKPSLERREFKIDQHIVETDFVCFTDNPSIVDRGWTIDATPWHDVNPSYLDTDPNATNSLKTNRHTLNITKYYKQQFYNIPRLAKYDIVIWIDGSIQIHEKFVFLVYSAFEMHNHQLIVFQHEMRENKLVREVIASNIPQYTSTFWHGQKQSAQRVKDQYLHYINNGYKDKYVCLNCIVALDMRSEKIKAFLDTWYMQVLTFSTQCQIGMAWAMHVHQDISYFIIPNDNLIGMNPHSQSIFHIKYGHGN